MGIKYYYSKPTQVRLVKVITDASGMKSFGILDSTFVKSFPRVTICSILEGDCLSFGYTVCAPKDVYRKNIGKKIAKGRAERNPSTVVHISDMKDINAISREIVNKIFDEHFNKCTTL